jgi:hypothetical protein
LILEKEGRNADAIKELEESLRLQPDFESAKNDLKRLKALIANDDRASFSQRRFPSQHIPSSDRRSHRLQGSWRR